LGIITGCAPVIGTPVALDDTNSRLLAGKWVGTFETTGATTGAVYFNKEVTFVLDGSGKGTYTTVDRANGPLAWKVADGKVMINVDQGKRYFRSPGTIDGPRDDFDFTLSREQIGSLYLQIKWNATARDFDGRIWPQIHSIVLKKQ